MIRPISVKQAWKEWFSVSHEYKNCSATKQKQDTEKQLAQPVMKVKKLVQAI